jgi:hypothetical protein
MSTPLKNQQHELFAQEIATGKTAEEAFRAVAGNDKPGGQAMATRWLTREDVQRRVAELIRERTAAATMTVAERRQIIAEIARDKNVPPAVRLNATIIDAKHAGEFMDYAEYQSAKENAPMTQLLNDLRGRRG